MSASLVGSEMCIRDRSQTAPTAGPSASVRHCDVAKAMMRLSKRSACLLYTSDAADDMHV
eukprot:6480663-Alexandrium_andersonii.AAC.1